MSYPVTERDSDHANGPENDADREPVKNLDDRAKSSSPEPEPPFPLYSSIGSSSSGSSSSTSSSDRKDFAEGFASAVNLLRGRKNVLVLAGAGISVSCGIPDFRSKGTGLYSTLDAAVRSYAPG